MTEIPTRNPEADYENEQVAGFADLADLAVDTLVRSKEEYEAAPYIEGTNEKAVHTGVSLGDIEGFMSERYPHADADEAKLKAARLFNRMAMESLGMPEPEDISRLDTSSYDARMQPRDVLAYAVAHGQEILLDTDEDEAKAFAKDKIGAFVDKIDVEDEFKATYADDIRQRMQQMGHRRTSVKYPNVPNYI